MKAEKAPFSVKGQFPYDTSNIWVIGNHVVRWPNLPMNGFELEKHDVTSEGFAIVTKYPVYTHSNSWNNKYLPKFKLLRRYRFVYYGEPDIYVVYFKTSISIFNKVTTTISWVPPIERRDRIKIISELFDHHFTIVERY